MSEGQESATTPGKARWIIRCVAVYAIFSFFWWQLIYDEPLKNPSDFGLRVIPDPVFRARDPFRLINKNAPWTRQLEGSILEANAEEMINGTMAWDAARIAPILAAGADAEKIFNEFFTTMAWEVGSARVSDGKSELDYDERLAYAPSYIRLPRTCLQSKAINCWKSGEYEEALRICDLLFRMGSRLQFGVALIDGVSEVVLQFNDFSELCVVDTLIASRYEKSLLATGATRLSVPVLAKSDLSATLCIGQAELSMDPNKHDDYLLNLSSSSRTRAYNKPAWLLRSRYKLRSTFNHKMLRFSEALPLTLAYGPENRRAAQRLREKVSYEQKVGFVGLDPNGLGKRLVAEQMMAWGEAETQLMQALARHACRAAAVAAKRWSLAHHGQAPASLDMLVPEYLTEIPIDPYSGNPVLWDKASGTIYVTGEDNLSEIPAIPASNYWVSGMNGTAVRLP